MFSVIPLIFSAQAEAEIMLLLEQEGQNGSAAVHSNISNLGREDRKSFKG